jgi:hypothetical protein
MELSEHFKTNKINISDNVYCAVKKTVMTASQYATSKGVSGADPKHIDDSRSLCQMIRNVNGMTNLTYHNKFIYVVNFANNAVMRLNQFKGEYDGRWGGPKTRSVFTEDKQKLGISYMETPHHSIFELLSEIYLDITNEVHKSYLEEVSYYFQRINERLLKYEQELGIIKY